MLQYPEYNIANGVRKLYKAWPGCVRLGATLVHAVSVRRRTSMRRARISMWKSLCSTGLYLKQFMSPYHGAGGGRQPLTAETWAAHGRSVVGRVALRQFFFSRSTSVFPCHHSTNAPYSCSSTCCPY
jgi:hypothetical protein